MNEIQPTRTSWLPELRSSVWWVSLVVGLAFFFNEHNVFISRQDNYTQSTEEMVATAGGGNMLRRVAFFMLAGVGATCFVLAAKKSSLRIPNVLGFLYAAMFALAMSSILWADDIGMCVRRLLVLALAIIGTIGLGRCFNLRELCFMALVISAGCIVLGVLCEVALGTFKPWLSDYRFSGTVHPNTQGMYLATMCCAALCMTKSDAPRQWVYWSIIAVGIMLLVLTKSRTSTAGVIASLGLVWFLLSSNGMRLTVPFIGAWVLAMLLLVMGFAGKDLEEMAMKVAFMGRQEETESFSGRTTIWPVVERYIAKRPLLGYGFECFWTPPHIEAVSEECEWAIREAHSAYRDMLLSLGAVGALLLLATILSGIIASFFTFLFRDEPCALFWFGVSLNGLFNGMFESGMIMTYFVTFIIAAGYVRLGFFNQKAAAIVPTPAPKRLQTYPSLAYAAR